MGENARRATEMQEHRSGRGSQLPGCINPEQTKGSIVPHWLTGQCGASLLSSSESTADPRALAVAQTLYKNYSRAAFREGFVWNFPRGLVTIEGHRASDRSA